MVDIDKIELVETCSLCGSGETKLLFWTFDRLYRLPGKFGTVQCLRCNLIRLSPRPTVEAISVYYPDDYLAYNNPASFQAIGKGDSLGVRDAVRNSVLAKLGYKVGGSNAIQKIAGRLLGPFFFEEATYGYGDRFPRYIPNGHALEIGCGNGNFLSYLKQHGWNVTGIDLSEHAARQAKENFDIDVHVGELEKTPLKDSSYDFIRLSHVVEHFFDPVSSMKKVFELLKPGGIVYVEVPNVEGAGAQISGKYWYGWDAPRHLFMFSPKSISETLEKAGFEIVKLETKLWDSFAWALNYQFEEETGEKLDGRPMQRPQDKKKLTLQWSEARQKFRKDALAGDIISCWVIKAPR